MSFKKKYGILGFTLIEVMVTLVLSVMVSFFVYTMMMSSYTAFRRLSSVSKNANSIRFFVSSISNSSRNACNIYVSGNALCFDRFDKNRGTNGTYITESYYFENGGNLTEDATKSTSVATLNSQKGSSLGVLKKKVTVKSGGAVLETVVVSNVIRVIYYSFSTAASGERYKRLNLGVVYDDIVDGKQNATTGKLEDKGTNTTEMGTDYTLSRIILCFCSRGYLW